MTATHEERVVRARAKVGSVLDGKYRLDRVVGVGGMAAVYAATHLRNASRVALKILHAEMAADANVRARFLREGYAANSVEHPGTVRILDDDSTEDGSVFLVMELLEGETIDQRWERNGHRLGDREVARLVYQVLDVLAAAHDKGIVHRDIKPENLFLTRAGAVKLLDFGIARLIEAPVTATRPGGIVGTPAFMAPEQVLGKAVDAQSDLYSVGATAFALLSKRYVHEAENAGEMMVIVGSRPARSLGLVCPDVPKPLAALFDRALRFEKTERWSDARTMKTALAAAYRESFDAPMPGSEEAEDETILRVSTGAIEANARGARSDRAASAVTVLTGATPVITQQLEPLPHGLLGARPRVWRPSVLAGVAGAVALVIAALVIFTAGGSAPPTPGASQPATSPPAAIVDRKNDRPSAWSAPADDRSAVSDPPSIPVESLPAVGPMSPMTAAATPPVATPAPPAARVAPAKPSGCAPPFTIDPATGKKKWKLECL